MDSKSKCFLFTSLLFAAFTLKAHVPNVVRDKYVLLKVAENGQSFRTTEKIKVQLLNVSGKEIYYDIGLQVKVDNRWEVYSEDVNGGDRLSVGIYSLAPKQIKAIIFQLTPQPWKHMVYSKARFFVRYGLQRSSYSFLIYHKQFFLVNK